MKIIFLDIDGPMIPATMILVDRMASFHRQFPATTIATLNKLCERTEAKIVFNTTHNGSWPDVPDIEHAMVAQGLDARYLHDSDLRTRYPAVDRGYAVEEWLCNHPEVTDWIALDDARFTEEDNLIWIDPDAGLHVGHLNLAIEKLGGRQVLILM